MCMHGYIRGMVTVRNYPYPAVNLDLQSNNVTTFKINNIVMCDSVSSQDQLDLACFFGSVQTLLHKTSELNL